MPSFQGFHVSISSVALASPTEALMVGYLDDGHAHYRTQAEKWDGAGWRTTPTPEIDGNGQLFDLAMTGSSNAWAVGRSWASPGAPYQTLIEHWDGTRWTTVSGPGVARGSSLASVTAVGPDDVWAVGDAGPNTLTEHWDGSVWTKVPSPTKGGGASFESNLQAVSALDERDIWAVGGWINFSTGASGAISEHWDGTAWRWVDRPTIRQGGVSDMAALGPGNVWAVGSYARNSVDATLVQRWNGLRWGVVSSPNPSPVAVNGGSKLRSLAAVSPSDIWAVGGYQRAVGHPSSSLAERWNGSAWEIVTLPGAPAGSSLWAVAALPSGVVLTAGLSQEGSFSALGCGV